MKIAKNNLEKLVTIELAKAGEKYYCIDCNQELISKNKKPLEIRKREIHFAHSVDCNGNLETYLHKVSKVLISQNSSIFLPKLGNVIYEKSENEYFLEGIYLDAMLWSSAQQIAIEIFVTHKTKDDKIDKFRSLNISAFEIDLSNLDYNADLEEIRRTIFENNKFKSILNLFEDIQLKKKSKRVWRIENIAVVVALVLLFKWLTNNKHGRKKRYR